MPSLSSRRTRVPAASAAAPAWIERASSPIHGQGVYARVPIPDGTRIIEYTGQRITLAEAKRRERARSQRHGPDAIITIFVLNNRHALDGNHRSNVARWINHSCAPNCRSEISRGRVWIVARRDIEVGEEITFDYGYTYREGLHHPCRCGAASCAGFIVSAHQRWLLRRNVGPTRESR